MTKAQAQALAIRVVTRAMREYADALEAGMPADWGLSYYLTQMAQEALKHK